ncbi:hypothetical protein [Puniceicoccus vermicola]|uniref:Uncharacterized protein n=1 Tax=Puniceicoccus vermicola TaxID=388746 RepID=A0A7X1E3F9_9BACT|nr:hypothetical protein [Puniceicoccus vermicola]MBC2600934.1 hypothetical protein [Puniceicoccus vermicola]
MPGRKVEMDLLKRVLQRNELDVRQVSQIIEDINKELEKEEEPKAPPVKKEFSIMVSDPEGKLQGIDLTGWVVQIPEGESPQLAKDKIIRAAYEFNTTPKGRRFPVETIGEACETVTARHFKEQGIWVKTKEPVLLVRTDNKIPKETSE